jgi:type VI secretion system Hcp family effector
MAKNEKLSRRAFGRITSGAAILLLMSSAAVLLLGPVASAGADIFLKVPGIDGESTDAAHKSWVAVSSVNSGDLKSEVAMENIGSQSSGSGAGKATADSMKESIQPRDTMSGMASGRRMHKPFVITKEVDKASPLLAQFCASGKHIGEVDVDMNGGHYKLEDVVIASDTKSMGGAHATETITLNYQKIEMN